MRPASSSGAEAIGPATADDGAHELAAAPGPANDPLDRHLRLSKPTDDGIADRPAQAPVAPAPHGGGQLARVRGCSADGRSDARHRAVHRIEVRRTGVLEQVPTIGYLPGTRAGVRRRRAIGAAAIARHHLDARMRQQPPLHGARGAIGQQVDGAPTVQIAADGAVAMPPPSGPGAAATLLESSPMRQQLPAWSGPCCWNRTMSGPSSAPVARAWKLSLR